MGRYFKIIGHDDVTVEISGERLARNVLANGRYIRFFNGTIIGEYDTPERATEVWEDLEQAAQDGESSFVLPKE